MPTSPTRPTLRHDFADALDGMAVPWQAEEYPDLVLRALNEPLACEMGLDVEWLRSPDGVNFLGGVELPAGAQPVAQLYSGFQFGQFSPRLGDGRALLLGEYECPDGRLVDIHLKGSGRTPTARGGDGRAPMDAVWKEYVYSEALAALNVPTSRVLAVLSTGRKVQRTTVMDAGLVVRVADSHLRVGSFHYAALADNATAGDAGGGSGRPVLPRLVDVAIARHYPHLDAEYPAATHSPAQRAVALFQAVTNAQAKLVASWMRAGFIHGVLNTDNVSIAGQTLDFGPCAFLEVADPRAVFSSIDTSGRYAFGAQPDITAWNLARMAESLLPLVGDVGVLQEVLSSFASAYSRAYTDEMARALGLAHAPHKKAAPLIDRLWALLVDEGADYAFSLRALADGGWDAADLPEHQRMLVPQGPQAERWLADWRALTPNREAMLAAVPRYTARNVIVRDTIAAFVRHPEDELARHTFEDLLAALRQPLGTDPAALSPRAAAWAERNLVAPPEQPEGAQPFITYCGT